MENYEITELSTPEKLSAALERVREAQKIFSSYSQEQVDKIFFAAATAANQARIPLAKMAAEETGMGIAENKSGREERPAAREPGRGGVSRSERQTRRGERQTQATARSATRPASEARAPSGQASGFLPRRRKPQQSSRHF